MEDVPEIVQLQQYQVQPDSPPPVLPPDGFMQKFCLYETRSNFYMVGRDKTRTFWKILKIDRKQSYRRTYGIVGFIKFLGPYYMVLITKRRQIGVICGHYVYAISKSEIIPLPSSAVRANMVNYNNENRYKKLLCMVDLTKDFYFSYSYHVMRSLQRNMCDNETGQVLYETMFVWNEFLTRGIRNILQNTLWTVALVYGFFKQDTLSISGRDLKLTLIARRSRHYAGTRYLKRGVNERGRVANDVEAEQILFEDIPEVSKRDQTYKTNEKKPRESILRTEFANAIDVINRDLSEERRLKFLHLDWICINIPEATPEMLSEGQLKCPSYENLYAPGMATSAYAENGKHNDDQTEDSDNSDRKSSGGNSSTNSNPSVSPAMIQKGVLRTNCIDCLDCTNVAQYAYGLAALGHQLHALGVTTSTKMDLDDPLAEELMGCYERMGDTLAHQSLFIRSWSDGNILRESHSPSSTSNLKKDMSTSGFPAESNRRSRIPSESTPNMYTSESELAYSSDTSPMPTRELYAEMQRVRYLEHENGDAIDCSNFVDLDWLSSSGNSREEELLERSMLIVSPTAVLSSENVMNGTTSEIVPSTSECGSSKKGRVEAGTELGYGEAHSYEVLEEFSNSFVRWLPGRGGVYFRVKANEEKDKCSGTVNFTDMKRVDLIKEIAAEFELIANRLSETEVATVASVVELEPQHLAEIAKRVQKLTGAKNVKLKTVIDKSLLAGIIIRYGNSGSKLSLITLRLLNVVWEFKNY
ncbi:hypothetical protein SASPL_126994 [Salvia splendens]|uniref:SAC domain-containing protein n=1 Tax=Salvia splendens TaxID=180675 RepID=A0A8X8XHY9_SALSN|nr:hypothetical protein SASPL_126994 [Salvia splendens]